MSKPNKRQSETGKANLQILPDQAAPLKKAVTSGGTAEEDRAGLTAEPPELCERTSELIPDRYSTETLDRAAQAHLARFTQGITPFGLASAAFTWWAHLAGSPGKQVQLVEKAAKKAGQLATFAATSAHDPETDLCIEPLEHDHRFDDEAWQKWPWNLIYQNFLLTQQWWYNATNDIDGLSRREEQVLSFTARQMLDLFSPSNFIPTNPEVLARMTETGGANLLKGWQNLVEDWKRTAEGKPPAGAEYYRPGREVAVTEGQVVHRSHLFELIQYAPLTDKVKSEPILITPAWIMKYYILDLSPHNSLVKYLVEQGFTVFMISWRNPTTEDRDLGMEDYLGAVSDALDRVGTIVPEQKVHAVGYCLGGTLLSAKAAQMARDGDDRLKTMTLFATQTDFEEPGELQLFISESEVSFLENMMWDQGYLDTRQMAGAFQLLRSRDLIWSRYVGEYLMGRRQEMFDLMAWNADATRLPYRMHSEYLRKLFLNNELAEGRFEVEGRAVAISDIRVPVFCVSTTSDHIAPWHSVYKLHLLSDTDITFILTNGGHNAGIVSEPGHEGREYSIMTRKAGERHLSPSAWQSMAEARGGSWWPALAEWLAEKSESLSEPPEMGGEAENHTALDPAPGTYVFQR